MHRSAVPFLSFALCALGACSSPSTTTPSESYAESIEAASQVGFSGDRAASLEKLAKAPLNQAEQTSLVDVLANSTIFSSDQTKILLELIHNPATTQATLDYIPKTLDAMTLFPGSRAEVMDAIAAAKRSH